MLYEFVTYSRTGHLGASGNLVFLNQSEYEPSGGSWYYTYGTSYLSSLQTAPAFLRTDTAKRILFQP